MGIDIVMAEPMSNEEQELLVAGYVLGDLDAEEAAILSRQFAANPSLWRKAQQLQSSLEVVFSPSEIAPPAHLKAAILQQAQVQSSATSNVVSNTYAESSARRRFVSAPWLKVWSGIAALIIGGLSISNFLLWRALRSSRFALDNQAKLEFVLEAEDTNASASAILIADPNMLKATLTVENLPPLPADQVYVLWTILKENASYTTDDKNAILTQVFTVDETGQFTDDILLPRAYVEEGIVSAIAITAEDADAPQKHESPPILSSGT